MITVLMVVPGMVSLSGKQAVNRIIRSKAIEGFNAASWLVRQFVELLEISLREKMKDSRRYVDFDFGSSFGLDKQGQR